MILALSSNKYRNKKNSKEKKGIVRCLMIYCWLSYGDQNIEIILRWSRDFLFIEEHNATTITPSISVDPINFPSFEINSSYLRFKNFGCLIHLSIQYLVRIYSVTKLVTKDIATDSAGNVYVLDGGSNRVQKITTDGTFVKEWNIN